VDATFRPVTERLQELAQAVQTLRVDRGAERASFEEMLRRQVEEQLATRRETARLSRALQSPQVRGFWGEQSLDRVLECAGLVEGRDYRRQPSVPTEDGHVRPDVIVRLPGQRQVIIDSKVPLQALLAASNADEPEARKAAFVQHARQVRAHIDRLSAVDYPGKAGGDVLSTAVLLFLPAEPMLERALRADAALLEYGAERGVFLVTPSTLLIALQTVAHVWRQEQLTENAERIRALGVELYDRISVLAGHVATMRRALVTLVRAFNAAAACLDKRVVATARKLKALGAGGPKALPSTPPIEAEVRAMSAPELQIASESPPDDGLRAA